MHKLETKDLNIRFHEVLARVIRLSQKEAKIKCLRYSNLIVVVMRSNAFHILKKHVMSIKFPSRFLTPVIFVMENHFFGKYDNLEI